MLNQDISKENKNVTYLVLWRLLNSDWISCIVLTPWPLKSSLYSRSSICFWLDTISWKSLSAFSRGCTSASTDSFSDFICAEIANTWKYWWYMMWEDMNNNYDLQLARRCEQIADLHHSMIEKKQSKQTVRFLTTIIDFAAANQLYSRKFLECPNSHHQGLQTSAPALL